MRPPDSCWQLENLWQPETSRLGQPEDLWQLDDLRQPYTTLDNKNDRWQPVSLLQSDELLTTRLQLTIWKPLTNRWPMTFWQLALGSPTTFENSMTFDNPIAFDNQNDCLWQPAWLKSSLLKKSMISFWSLHCFFGVAFFAIWKQHENNIVITNMQHDDWNYKQRWKNNSEHEK